MCSIYYIVRILTHNKCSVGLLQTMENIYLHRKGFIPWEQIDGLRKVDQITMSVETFKWCLSSLLISFNETKKYRYLI